jgi:hypothetical protein
MILRANKSGHMCSSQRGTFSQQQSSGACRVPRGHLLTSLSRARGAARRPRDYLFLL